MPEKTLGHWRYDDGTALLAGFKLGKAGHAGQVDAVVAQQLVQAFAPPLAFGHHEHAMRRGLQMLVQLGQWLGRAALGAQVGQGAGVVHRLGASQHQAGAFRRQRKKRFGLEE